MSAQARRCVGVAVSILVGCLLAMAPASAVASTSNAETISTQFLRLPGPGILGSFTASGAFSDSGSLSSNTATFHDLPPTPPVLAAERPFTFAGGNGTINVNTHLVVTFPDAIASIKGTWVIVSGTGPYASLHGAGTLTGSISFLTSEGTITFQGEVTFGSS